MSAQMMGWVSLLVFVLVIVIGVKRKVNLGILAIAAAFLFGFFIRTEGGSLSCVELKGRPVTSLFPLELFWMIVSVSILLNIGTVNGSFDIVIQKLVGLVKGRRALIPVYLFVIVLVGCSLGAGTTGAVVLLCTLAVNIARDQEIDPVFTLLSVLTGASAAAGSPVAVIGMICNDFSVKTWGEQAAPYHMFPGTVLMSVASFAVVYVLFRGWRLKPFPVQQERKVQKADRKQIMTLCGMVLFLVLAIGVGFEIGLCAFLIAAALLLLGCADEKQVIAEVPWQSVLMICGMCMLIGVVNLAGGMGLLTDFLSRFMTPFTGKPLYSLIGSLLSMVSSITGVVLPTMLPTIPEVAAQTGQNPYALMTALAFGANITCSSPVGSMGAIAVGIMSSVKEWDADRIFKRMLLYTVILMAVAAGCSVLLIPG